MHVQSCPFANLNLLLFCCSPSLFEKLSTVVIKKFCYHGNVTSHPPLYFLGVQSRFEFYEYLHLLQQVSYVV